ncbi:hypothetical protein Pan216_37190 [Planctomycetes bacterium Pan216]|uniref:Prophage CP4-57 regulatory protein (AlpA) n=1 Tax=Kolteria novifilia TaxID=2527975 RepID=A0A518B792_9BACT|nr:hypothetical protein Pan216_37190 [Planctomycetes bacterium Pan216]
MSVSVVEAEATLSPTIIMVRAPEAARLVGVSLRKWWVMDSSGACPAPVRLGRSKHWLVEDLKSWASLGCPPREEFQARKQANQAG